MIKVKMGEIVGSQGAIEKLIALPVKAATAIQLKHIFFELKPYWENFAAVKNQKIKEHGTLNEKGITELSSDHENYPLFLEELTEAAHVEVSLNIDKLEYKDLKNSKEVELDLEARMIIDLHWLFE